MINKLTNNLWQFYFKAFGSCVYLLKINNKNILIDTSTAENQSPLIQDLNSLHLNPEDINIILLTHNHWDHNGNIDIFSNAKLYNYDNIDELPIKDIEIHKVPGHTKDSLAFLYKDILFSGDTLFNNGIGRTDLPESIPSKMQDSLKKLKGLKYKILCPGHI